MTFKQRYWLQAFVRTHAQVKSVLAMLCLAISIVTLLLVLALQAGTAAQMALILEDTGNRNLTVSAGTIRGLPNRGSAQSLATNLTLHDYAALREQAQGRSSRSAAVSMGASPVEFRELAITGSVLGVEQTYFALQHFQLAEGRLLDAVDEQRRSNVVVIGARVAEQLFGERQERVLSSGAIIGVQLRIGKVPFEVIGVLHGRGSGVTGVSQDDKLYVPLSTAMEQLFDVDYLSNVILETRGPAEIRSLRTQLPTLLRQRHLLPEGVEDDFTLLDAASAIEAAQRNQEFTTVFFRWLAILMLTMAGVGLFAVNHMGAKAREHEFGLRRAVGAMRLHVLGLVLGETLLLGVGGAIVGLVLGITTFGALAYWTSWALQVDAWIIVQVTVAALLLSIAASLLPALQAAWRKPVQALNQE